MGPLSAQVEGVLFFESFFIIILERVHLSLPCMGRIMAIDYGLKRSGVSVTDPLQIVVNGLETQKTEDIMTFIESYVRKEVVDKIVVGYPFVEEAWGEKNFKIKLDEFILALRKKFPDMIIDIHDERFSSFRAKEIIQQSGFKKKKRRDKGLLDKTSAVVILQEYLGHI